MTNLFDKNKSKEILRLDSIVFYGLFVSCVHVLLAKSINKLKETYNNKDFKFKIKEEASERNDALDAQDIFVQELPDFLNEKIGFDINYWAIHEHQRELFH